MRSRSRPSPEGTRSLLASRSVSPTMCPGDKTTEGRQKRPAGRQAKMRVETKPNKTRVDRNEMVAFRWICICQVCRGFPVWHRIIHCDISPCILRHIAVYRSIFSHIMRYHKIRYIETQYRIHIPKIWDWYRDVAYRRNIFRFFSLFDLASASASAIRDIFRGICYQV